MDYNFIEIEQNWRKYWAENKTFRAEDFSTKPKYYVLDMFPYPSGAGLHVGHPLGYIASDIYARYKRHQGYNVLHPMGYDSFGLPAEQYAIQTGQHPAITTEQNIARYREQLDKIGFSFDWDREVRTSNPDYYKWTQWIFKQLFDAWYNNDSNKAERISALIERFEKEGNANINAAHDCEQIFTAAEWKAFSEKEKRSILMSYRLTYLADSWVNWCPALGTVLANDEVVNGVSERGGHPVEQKLMRQWSMRIKAYAERLLQGLDKIDWSDAIKEQQRNWIGKSEGCSVRFEIEVPQSKIENQTILNQIEVFTTRPDTIFGVNFLVLAPEHPLVDALTTDEYREAVESYKKAASLKNERDRQADTKNITGQKTGGYAIHPFTGEKVDIWIGDYVLASYGTGAVMAVPCGDQRDWDFATHFKIPIINIFEDVDVSQAAYTEKSGKIANSDFLSGLEVKAAIKRAIEEIETRGLGKGKTNYRLRDAVFSRQRFWGEPFPVYYQDEIPYTVDDQYLPVELPEVDAYLPTADGEPPLARAKKEAWNVNQGDRMEFNTMPGWAGSSWYFLRYMDPQNDGEFVAKEKADYWQNVDLYIGGSEHATGHLLYSRFWTKFLHDMGYISFDEPFKKLINQGMILGRSSFVYRMLGMVSGSQGSKSEKDLISLDNIPSIFISSSKRQLIEDYARLKHKNEVNPELAKKFELIKKELKSKADEISNKMNNDNNTFGSFSFFSNFPSAPLNVYVNLVDNDKLDVDAFKNHDLYKKEYANAEFILEDDGTYLCGSEVEKMSKSKYNVQTPDELVEKYGADTLRMYEMFLGPLEQAKPWDTKGINGVHNFLRKLWRLTHDEQNKINVSDGEPSAEALKTLHKTIKKITEDLERYSFNTPVSAFMIAVNELTDMKCNNRAIIEPLVILLEPFAPHFAEQIWKELGHTESISKAAWPVFNPDFLVENTFEYPVSFNGKVRFKISLPAQMSKEDVEQEVMKHEQTQKYLEGKAPKKMIVVPGRIVNVVV